MFDKMEDKDNDSFSDHSTSKPDLSQEAPTVESTKKPLRSLKSVSFAVTAAVFVQGATAKGMNATYAKFIPVHVPLDLDKTHIRDVLDLSHKTKEEMKENEGRNLSECYEKIPTRLVKMEERNIFCGAYNILILQDM